MSCTCHFQGGSLFFVYFGFLCKSLQCLISALTQGVTVVTYLGSLVQLCCGEGGTLQTNTTGVCGECLQWMDHSGFAPLTAAWAFRVYTAQAPGCSAGHCSKWALRFCARPRPKPLRFRFLGTPQGHRLGWACILCPSQVLGEHTVPGRPCILTTSLVLGVPQEHRLRCIMCLLWEADLRLPPSWQISTYRIPGRHG